VIERFFESVKYEHLYRHDIADGPGLADHVDGYISVYNEVRPHEALDFKPPLDRYVKPPPITLAPVDPDRPVQMRTEVRLRRTLTDPSAARGRRVKPAHHHRQPTTLCRLEATGGRSYPPNVALRTRQHVANP